MTQRTPGFEDRLIEVVNRLDPDQVQAYLRRLLAHKQFLLSIFDHMQEGVLVTDEALRVQFINRRARQLLGWGRGRRPLGEDLYALIDEDHPLRPHLAALRERLQAIEGFEYADPAYGERMWSFSARPLRVAPMSEAPPTNEQTLILMLWQDVTDRHRRLSEQARARRLATLATLTAGLAHEIKNPLNSINIHAQLLQSHAQDAERAGQGVDPAKVLRASSVIREETERLTRTVEQFIQAARPRRPDVRPQSIAGVLERAERIFRPECDQAGIALELAVEPGLPPVMLDEHLMLQAVRNLIRNAIDALNERAAQARRAGELFAPRLRLEARLAGDVVELAVADNGPGIAPEALEHIFEPYYTTRHHGTGLGLMIVERIVGEHRGRVRVESKPGEGARFLIELPVAQRPLRLLENQAASATTDAPREAS